MSLFGKQHYEFIARVLGELAHDYPHLESQIMGYPIGARFCWELSDDNENFSREKFWEAVEEAWKKESLH